MYCPLCNNEIYDLNNYPYCIHCDQTFVKCNHCGELKFSFTCDYCGYRPCGTKKCNNDTFTTYCWSCITKTS